MNLITNNYNPILSHANFIQATAADKNVPFQLLDYLKANVPVKDKKRLMEEIKELPTQKLLETLDEFFTYLTEQEDTLDASKSIKRLCEMIPLKKLEDAVRIKFPQHKTALHTAKSLFKDAQYYLEMCNQNHGSHLLAKLQVVVDALITCLESLIRAFGVSDFFKPSETDMQASTKAQRVFALFSLFGLLLTALVPVIGATVAAPLVGGVLLVIAALSLVYPYIKPMPHRIHKTVNWSKLIQEGNLTAPLGNKKYLDAIAQALITGKKVKTHPMLIGKSGVGKTETVKAFVKAVERGDYPELKGKKVFYINSADLLNGPGKQEGGNKELQKISEEMGRHRKDIILIFDEIHILCQKKNNILAEQLKTFLDDAHEGFPNVIGITTQQEFFRDIYRHNAAFARRFKQINIDNLADKDVEQILNGIFIQKTPFSLIDHQALSYLHQKTKEALPEVAQPAASIKILSKCIKYMDETQKAPLEDKIEEVRKKIDILNAENVLSGDGLLPYDRKNFDQIHQLEKQLDHFEKALKVYQKDVAKFYQKREKLRGIKKQVYKNIQKISIQAKKKGKVNPLLLKEYLLQSHFFAPTLEKKVRQHAEQLEVKAILNPTLIDEVIAAEVKNQELVNMAVQNGKEDVEAREG